MIFRIKDYIKHIVICIIACYVCYIFAEKHASYLNIGAGLGVGIICMGIAVKIAGEYDVSKKAKEIVDIIVIDSTIICIIFIGAIYCIQKEIVDTINIVKSWGMIYSIEIVSICAYIILRKIAVRELIDKKKIFIGITGSIMYGALYLGILISRNIIGISTFIIMSIVFYIKIWKEYAGGFCKDNNYFAYFILIRIAETIYVSIYKADNIMLMIWLMFRFIQTYYLTRCTIFNGIEKSIYREYGVIDFFDKKTNKQNKTSYLISSLSHELKTPINVIRSAVEIISLDNDKNNIFDEDIKEIKNECAVIMNMVQMIVDIQKVNDNKENLNIHKYNIVELLENISCAFNMEYSSREIIFDTYEEEVYVNVNKSLLQDAIMGVLNIIGSMDSKCSINLHICKNGEKKIEVLILHSQISYIESVVNNLNNELFLDSEKENMINILGVQVLLEVIKSYAGQVIFRKYNGDNIMAIMVEEDTNELTDVYEVSEWNIMELRENIKLKYLI